MPPGPFEPPLKEFDVEPSPSEPITELPPPEEPRELLPPVEARLEELTLLVADCMAEELREVDCAPLELATLSEPSAPTELPPLPPLEPPADVPVARELTWLFELREELNDRLSRPKPEREPRSCGASNCANRSAPVDPVSRMVFTIGPETAFAVRMSAIEALFFCSADAWR